MAVSGSLSPIPATLAAANQALASTRIDPPMALTIVALVPGAAEPIRKPSIAPISTEASRLPLRPAELSAQVVFTSAETL